MIVLYTGCRYSSSWDEGLRHELSQRKLQYTEHHIDEIGNHHGEISICRIDQSYRHIKEAYYRDCENFIFRWPESMSIYLYDDKAAQIAFLKGYPTPRQVVVHEKKDAIIGFPVVQKLPHGSSSKNVDLINSADEIILGSIHQEFCYNNDRDYRVTVIGDYVMACARLNRPNDFRASGSNNCVILDEIPLIPARIAWEICRSNNIITMAFDFLKLNGEWVIIEMSYTYPLYSILNYSESYLDMKNGTIVRTKPNPIAMIIDEIMSPNNHLA